MEGLGGVVLVQELQGLACAPHGRHRPAVAHGRPAHHGIGVGTEHSHDAQGRGGGRLRAHALGLQLLARVGALGIGTGRVGLG